MKICTKCGVEKDASGFHRRSDTKDGLTSHCRLCRKSDAAKFYSKNASKINARQRKLRQESPEIVRAWEAKYRAKNRDSINAKTAEYCAANPMKRAETNARYRAANKEKVRDAVARWNAKHPNARRIVRQNRRAGIMDSSAKLSPGLADKLMVLQRGRCACCGRRLGRNFHLDHIMPIALGGRNEDSNIQLLRATCNLKKNKRHPVEYMQGRGFLL